MGPPANSKISPRPDASQSSIVYEWLRRYTNKRRVSVRNAGFDVSETDGLDDIGMDSMYEHEDGDTNMEGPIAPANPDPELSRWNMTRFLLNEERDRLFLWKFNISDKGLNRLVSKQDVLSNSVLDSLLRIGKALLENASTFLAGSY